MRLWIASVVALGLIGACGPRARDTPQDLSAALEQLELEASAPVVAPETRASPAYRQIIVKFREGSGVRLRSGDFSAEPNPLDTPRLMRDGGSVDLVQSDLANLNALFGRSNVRFTRALDLGELAATEALGENALDQIRFAAQANVRRELPDLNLFYAVDFPESAPVADINAFLDQVREAPSVEQAYVAPRLLNASDIAPPTRINLGPTQDYLGPAPLGVDVAFARTLPGGRGENVSIANIEFSWNAEHEDFPGASRLLVNFGASNNLDHRNHGTAVMGVLVGEENEFGITGMAPRAQFAFVSPQFDRTHNVGAAMLIAVSHLRPGDIILLEQHLIWPNAPPCPANHDNSCAQYGALPVESDPLVYATIAQLVASGYVVLEAAGNGEQRVDRDAFHDSGAIMVGAGAPRTRAPEWFTNYGSRVDVQAWGSRIATLGYGENNLRANGGDERQWYMDNFGGTSGALPIVAGAAALIQSTRRAAGRRPLTSVEMRNLLASTGSAQPAGARNIGPRPNLRAAIAASNAIGP